ncbi:MAG: hypothetical protein PHH08_01555 [Candidatus ainarchaeum sp.]|nr:hypothetical protein [Candidatus ainarchaeum sp.]
MLKKTLFLLCLLLLPSSAFAVIGHDSIKVFAVTEDGQSAMAADLGLTIEAGNGTVWSSVEPLIGTSTQTTQKIAVQVAKNYFPKVSSYDYKFDINSSASLVDGPSAGAAMALLAISMLNDKKIPEEVGITGTITGEGGIGQVGGVFKKAQEAARIGIELFMIPAGEAKQIAQGPAGAEYVNLVDYAGANWGMKVIEVSNIGQALKYAFADIKTIDINSGQQELPDFMPKPIAASGSVYRMHGLTDGYIKRASDAITNARKSLTGTLLNDADATETMLAALTSAEKDLQDAKILFDQNYFYSSANYAFLAQVNAMFVDDLSKNPSLLDSSSTVLDLKLIDLKKEASKLKRDLNDFVPVEDWEWHIAAQQRLSWAEEKIDSLLDKQTIVIGIDGATPDSFQKLLDYEFAVAWLGVAKDFDSLTLTSAKKVRSKPMFGDEISTFMLNTENNLVSIQGGDSADITRRLATAKNSQALGWSTASLFDAASAFALSNADNYIKNKDLNRLESMLRQKIPELQGKIDSEEKGFVWAQLYLDHANYYLQGIDFYKGHGLDAQALEMAQSGVSIFFLAESVFNVSKTAGQYYSNIPSADLVENTRPVQGLDINPVVIIVLAAAIVFLAALFAFVQVKSASPKNEEKKINLDKAKARLDKLFADKKISSEKYVEMNSILESRRREIENDREMLSRTTIKIDKMRFELQAMKRTLGELERQKKSGIITSRGFEKASAKIKAKSGYLEKALGEGQKDVSAEKEKIKTDTSEYSREAKEMVKPDKKQAGRRLASAKKTKGKN